MDTLVDLVADSLRSLCRDQGDGDRAIWLMATIVDLHLADSLSPDRTGRWMGEATEALVAMLAQPLQVQVHRYRAEQGVDVVAADETAPCHLSLTPYPSRLISTRYPQSYLQPLERIGD
ncbi:hypothetical protein [Lysobacter sp. GCM10012299]|uniref:hypothetical protein n=1 Tax=Lysobacter sp. GCM10012299 TaxID=3317333 RepID=UPI00360D95EE